MPTQLYVDLQLMIKNVFFCAAKEKVQDPNNNMYIILLGTDQLETSFGILCTMVGNDTNADALQLSTRLAHVSEIQNILAAHLAWDCSPHRLKLPSWDEVEMKSQHMDHVTPTLWKGDVTVNTVTLLTCWKDGRTLASSLDLEVEMALDLLTSMSNIDMLSPLGALIIKLDAQLPSTAVDDTLELENKDDVQDATLPTAIHTGETINSSSGTEVELDLEDMITSETDAEQQEPSHSISHYLTIQAQDGTEKKVHKSRALKVLSNQIPNTKPPIPSPNSLHASPTSPLKP